VQVARALWGMLPPNPSTPLASPVVVVVVVVVHYIIIIIIIKGTDDDDDDDDEGDFFLFERVVSHYYTLATRGCGCDKNDKNDFKKKEFFNNKLETKKQTKQKVTRDA